MVAAAAQGSAQLPAPTPRRNPVSNSPRSRRERSEHAKHESFFSPRPFATFDIQYDSDMEVVTESGTGSSSPCSCTRGTRRWRRPGSEWDVRTAGFGCILLLRFSLEAETAMVWDELMTTDCGRQTGRVVVFGGRGCRPYFLSSPTSASSDSDVSLSCRRPPL
jgi:hypothetical protein